MKIYALADLHLCLGVPEKTMEVFGDPWVGYIEKIRDAWTAIVSDEDWVLVPGDISWGKNAQEAEEDFRFIGSLPGNKIMIRGNHDYWSSSSTSKLLSIFPSSIIYLKSGVFRIPGTRIDVVGTRLWDHPSIKIPAEAFMNPRVDQEWNDETKLHNEKIFDREYLRLKDALKNVSNDSEGILAMTHYPPISFDGSPSLVSELLESFKVRVSVFGHLHGLRKAFPEKFPGSDVRYRLVSCDYVHFCPQQIL